MDRRTLLRLLAVTGLAGCTTGIDEVPVIEGTPAAAPSTRSRPTSTDAAAAGPSPAASEPSPSPTEPAPTDEPTPAPSPSSETPSSPEPSPSTTSAPEEDATPAATPDPPSPTPSSPSEEPPTPAGDPRTVVAVGRDALGLPSPRSGGRRHAITGLAVHHTASPTGPASTAPGRWRGITAAHRDQGWVDVAYHWGVDVAGNVYELRDESIAGDTNTGYDPAGWFLVVCEGNFEESSPPRAMLDAVADVLAAGAARHGVSPSTLRGHRELAATLCPGANLQARLGELRAAVEARLADGGVSLRVDDDPARVAAIEAG